MEKVVHNIDPVFDENSRVLVLGSFPSPQSRNNQFYYGNPQNRMWRVLSEVLSCPVPETIGAKRALLLENNIAMWDVLAECVISGASDSSICCECPNNLDVIFDTAKIRAVFLAGAAAYSLYEKYHSSKYKVFYCRLPSTSPANAGFSVNKLVDAYKIIGNYL